ncbi:NifU-like N terminal domain-containing protein [Syntrophus gentianae]|uniref:NifU-like N terminal domain-containing protein n=1 Tax=Syntrophus gentianae TaxID=43775 RepID=A0A1H8A0C7_9BACT|nr:iron-sulfur cluster assembly scaffold protein [Syntrophus gentianae]SEM63308.1 NifU-like N terminal domain-containing protein [Syntrophus gentianae]
MDEVVMAYYRKLVETGFEHAGSLEDASIFLENFAEISPACGGNTNDFMHIYINVVNEIISDIKYRSICDQTTNVAIEVLCTLVKGKTLGEVAGVTEQTFSRFLGSEDKRLQETAKDLLEFLNKGIADYRAQTGGAC